MKSFASCPSKTRISECSTVGEVCKIPYSLTAPSVLAIRSSTVGETVEQFDASAPGAKKAGFAPAIVESVLRGRYVACAGTLAVGRMRWPMNCW